MVFFSCDGCAEMLKKNQVDGHAMKCRRCVSVSCVDCSVAFFGGMCRRYYLCFGRMITIFIHLEVIFIRRVGILQMF
jgi:hypothetical protein